MKRTPRNVASPCKYEKMIKAGMARQICVKEAKGKKVRANRI